MSASDEEKLTRKTLDIFERKLSEMAVRADDGTRHVIATMIAALDQSKIEARTEWGDRLDMLTRFYSKTPWGGKWDGAARPSQVESILHFFAINSALRLLGRSMREVGGFPGPTGYAMAFDQFSDAHNLKEHFNEASIIAAKQAAVYMMRERTGL